MKSRGKIFSPSKVDSEKHKIEAYLRGERIFPTTIEIDLTHHCTRHCPGCPYTVARSMGLTLQIPFLDRLFSILGPHTPGIVLSGGESTIVPHFPETVKLARKKGFKEVAVISNGANIHKPEVQDACWNMWLQFEFLSMIGRKVIQNLSSIRCGKSKGFVNVLKRKGVS